MLVTISAISYAEYFSLAFLILTALTFLYLIVSILSEEGAKRTGGYIWRFIEGKFCAFLYRIQHQLTLPSILSLFWGVFNVLAQAIILCTPIFLKNPDQSPYSSLSALLKSGYLLPICLIFVWMYKAFKPTKRKWLPIVHEEKKRLLDTSKAIMEIGDLLKTQQSHSLDAFAHIRKSLLEDIVRKVQALLGFPSQVDIHASLLIPHDQELTKMLVIERSGKSRDKGITYDTNSLAAGKALKQNAVYVVHKLKHFVKDNVLTGSQRDFLLSKPYKTVLALPIRSKGENKEPMVIGSVSIDSNKPYFFRTYGREIEIAIQPYLNLIALTLPDDIIKVPTEREPNYLTH